MNTVNKMMEIFSVVLELPDDTDFMKIRKLNSPSWDSLAQVSIIVAMESEFDILLDTKDYERLTSFKSALLLIEENLA